jgi:hypothetical protein
MGRFFAKLRGFPFGDQRFVVRLARGGNDVPGRGRRQESDLINSITPAKDDGLTGGKVAVDGAYAPTGPCRARSTAN